MLKNLTLTALLLFVVLRCFSATPVDSILNPKVAGNGYVSDVNHILSQGTTDKINVILKRLDSGEFAQVAVVLVNTIGEEVPKEFATELFRYWGIGDKATNNGLLILLVKDQRRIEFEVGYGLEGVIPDMISNRIQQKAMIPNLKKGDYDAAVLEGVKMVANTLENRDQKIKETYSDADDSDAIWVILSGLLCIFYVIITFLYALGIGPSKLGRSSRLTIAFVIIGPVLLVILLTWLTPIRFNYPVVILSMYFCWAVFFGIYFKNIPLLDPREERYTARQVQYTNLNKELRGLKTYTIIFPLPLLIFFYKKIQKKLKNLRYSPYPCEKCKQDMQMLTENRESFLSDGEKCAENLAAVTYDVWRCEKDNVTLKIDFINDKSAFLECRKCNNITALKLETHIEKKADYDQNGIGYDYYSCEYCKERFNLRYIIPHLIYTTSFDSSSGSGSSSSGSSSSSSSSSSSWGGGSSGGGGSGSNW